MGKSYSDSLKNDERFREGHELGIISAYADAISKFTELSVIEPNKKYTADEICGLLQIFGNKWLLFCLDYGNDENKQLK